MQGLKVNDHSESVPDLLNRYNGHFTSVLDKQAPKKEKCVVKPWFTDELHQAKNEKRRAERLWRRTGLTVHKEYTELRSSSIILYY